MRTAIIVDRDRLRAFFRRAPAVHVYELGDLDDRFWPKTQWHGLEDDSGTLVAVALVFTASELPVVLALDGEPCPSVADSPVAELLGRIAGELPGRIYGHLSPGLAAALAPRFAIQRHRDCSKLALVDRALAETVDTARVVSLGPADLAELEAFYAHAYPDNAFAPWMLDTGFYVGIRDQRDLVACGGVHVYSPSERVAALGNIATAPAHRGTRLATAIVAELIGRLAPTVDHLGLNVKADNHAAIRCYERLGFQRVAAYQELLMVARFFTLDYVERALLRDGTPVRLRLVAPEDKALLASGFDRLSAQSRYARFLTPKERLSADELRYLTEVDHEDHFALGAVREDGDGHGEPIGLGIARFIRLDPTTAEAAIAVADEVHGQGLGKLLFLRLVAAAAERGITRFRLEVLASNAAMQELVRKISPDHTVSVGSGVCSIELGLPDVAPAQPLVEAPPQGPLYRLFRLAASNAVDFTDAVRRLWRR